MKIFCLAPSIWPTLHYEADLILQEANKSSEAITVITCNKFRQDCPANILKSELVCTVCRMRNGNLKKFINSRLDKKEVNFVNFENIANYNKKEIFKKNFGNGESTIYKELLKSVLSSQQTTRKTKGFKSWGYDELSKPFWDTHFNFIETISQIRDNQNISSSYIYNCRLSGYKAIYEYMKHIDVDRYVYEYPIEEKKRLFILFISGSSSLVERIVAND